MGAVWLRIFHYSPWYTYAPVRSSGKSVENLSLFALIYLPGESVSTSPCWESFIIRLDILTSPHRLRGGGLRIFHYSPWYTYPNPRKSAESVENLSLFALIYLAAPIFRPVRSWESFIIRLDILILANLARLEQLRIFHYSPWYTYPHAVSVGYDVENLSLFALIYLPTSPSRDHKSWESFIIRLDILSL